jgi:hypothetical protein
MTTETRKRGVYTEKYLGNKSKPKATPKPEDSEKSPEKN